MQRSYTTAPTPWDVATQKPGEAIPGHNNYQWFTKWGYARYNTSDEPLLTLSDPNSGVTVQSNLAGGGAVWRWIWNGMQFVNHYGFGRQMQASMYIPDHAHNRLLNPTEAGDTYAGNNPNPAYPDYLPPEDRHGSPLLSASNGGTPQSPTQSTQALPLEFFPGIFTEPGTPGGPDHPVVFKDMVFGKDVTLNYNNMGPVARYRTLIYSPVALPDAWLYPIGNGFPATFNRFYTYAGWTNQVTEVQIPACTWITRTPVVGNGLIISDPTGNYAMGVFGMSTYFGGIESKLKIGNDIGCTTLPGSGELDFSNTYWSIKHDPPIPQGWSTYDSWIVNGTVSNVGNLMHQLYESMAPEHILVGHVTWQGRPAPPSSLYAIPITITLKSSAIEVNYPQTSTDEYGFFAVSVDTLPNDTYNWRVKGPDGIVHTDPDPNGFPGFLANAGMVTLSGEPTTQVEMGLMQAGDANNDNIINSNDFTIYRAAFGTSCGGIGFDKRADFNGNCVVNAQDFTLLSGNFGHAGAPPIRP